MKNTVLVDNIGKEVICPSVHLNGTSFEELHSGIDKQFYAVRDALDSLEANWPNARDYYVQGPDAFSIANKQHTEWLRQLQDIMLQLRAIGENVYNQKRK